MRDRWKKKAYYTVVLILTALCLISGCGQESGEELKEISLEETQEEKKSPLQKKRRSKTKNRRRRQRFLSICAEQSESPACMKWAVTTDFMKSLPWRAD